MKINKILGGFFIFALLILPAYADQIISSIRDLPTSAFIDAEFNVTISVDINENNRSSSYLVLEEVPNGLEVTNAGGGTYSSSANTIYWFVAEKCNDQIIKIDCPVEDKTFAYTVRATSPGTYVFSGRASTLKEQVATTGDEILVVGSGDGGNIDNNPPAIGSISPTSVTVGNAQTYVVGGISDDSGFVDSCTFSAEGQEKQMNVPSDCSLTNPCQATVNHIFSTTGQKIVTVSCTDPSGNTGSKQFLINVMSEDNSAPVIQNINVYSITDKSAIISWTTNEPSTSIVEYGLTDLYGYRVNDSSFNTTHSLKITGLSPQTVYHFRIISVDANGNIAMSDDQTFETTVLLSDKVIVARGLPDFVDVNETFNITYDIEINESQGFFLYIIKDSIPQNIEILEGGYFEKNTRKLYISGIHRSGNDEDRVVIVKAKVTNPGAYSFDGTVDVSGGTFSIIGDNTLTVNGQNEENLIISNIQALPLSPTSVLISWQTNLPSDSLVEYGLDSNYGNSESNGSLVLNHQITLTGLNSGTEYHFKVRSTTSGGETAVSNDRIFTTPPSLQDNNPPVISNINVNVLSSTEVQITWNTDELSNSIVEYGLDSNYGNQKISNVLTMNHFITLTNLNPNTEYHFRVKSIDSYGNTAVSDDRTFTTGQGNYSINVRSLKLLNNNFVGVSEIPAGGQYNVKVVIKNMENYSIKPMTIVEVLDGNLPVNIGTVKAKVDPGEEIEVTVGFKLPENVNPGKIYKIKVFNWNNWISQGDWRPLSSPMEFNLRVAQVA